MKVERRDALHAPAPKGGYAQTVTVTNALRAVYVSGQVPVDAAGQTPAGYEAQCRLVWRNLELQLQACGMSLDNLIKVTTYLSDRKFGELNGEIRREILGDLRPALTVVVAGIFDEAWLLEIEAVAAE